LSCAWISANSTLLVVPQWPSYRGEEGWKEILLLRVDPSRFPGIPNRATRPITIVCSLLRVHPGGAGCPAPKPPAGLTPPARGGGCYIFPVPAHSKMKIKRFWFCMIFFHMRPHIRTEPEPFNCTGFKTWVYTLSRNLAQLDWAHIFISKL
jgi:hypothetical protein